MKILRMLTATALGCVWLSASAQHSAWVHRTELASEWSDLATDADRNVWSAVTVYPAPVILHRFSPQGIKQTIPLPGNYKGKVEVSEMLFGKDGLLYLAGHFSGKVTVGSFSIETAFSGSDFFVLTYDPKANTVRRLQKIDLNGDEKIRAFTQDTDGNLWIGGYSEHSAPKHNQACLVRLTPEGKILHHWLSEGSGTSAVFALTPNPKGGVYATGWFDGTFPNGNEIHRAHEGSDIWIASVGANGTWKWLQTAGGNDWECGRAIATDEAGNVYAGGWFWGKLQWNNRQIISAGASDGWIAKLSPAGELQWIQSWGSDQADALFDLKYKNGQLWGCGWLTGNVALGATTLSATGDRDAFAFRADGNGNILKTVTWGGNEEDKAHGIVIDERSLAYVIGYHDQPASDSESTTEPFSFIAQWGDETKDTPHIPTLQPTKGGLNGLNATSVAEIYPNPAKEYLNVRLTDVPSGNYRLTLIDVSGKEILTVEPYFDAMQDRFTWMLPELPSGHYILSVRQAGQSVNLTTQKVIIP